MSRHMPCRMTTIPFHDTPPAEISTLSLHDALPISAPRSATVTTTAPAPQTRRSRTAAPAASASSLPASSLSAGAGAARSEEHTSELQSLRHLVCRLLLEKKKRQKCLHMQHAYTYER